MQKSKGVSTLVGIIIIIVVAVVLFGGVFAYQYFATKLQHPPLEKKDIQIKPTTCNPNWQCNWGACVNNSQMQSWTDSNNCGLPMENVGACPRITRICAATNNQTADWKTYTSTQYGFKFQYPSNWTVNNQSFIYQNKPSINVLISSPVHARLTPNQDAIYLLEIGVASSGKKVINSAGSGFFKAPFIQADGGPVKLNIDGNTVINTPEYGQAQEIFSTFKFTK
jgi:hypothetical protein